EAADRFHEIAVRPGVAGDDAPERGDNVERIKIINRIETRYVHGGEFQAEEASADAQHAISLAQRRVDAWHVANAEGDGDRVVAAFGKRQRLGVAFDEGNRIIEPAFGRARSPECEHVGIDVDDGRARAAA